MKREVLQALMAAIIDSGNESLTVSQLIDRSEVILTEIESRYYRATKSDLHWEVK